MANTKSDSTTEKNATSFIHRTQFGRNDRTMIAINTRGGKAPLQTLLQCHVSLSLDGYIQSALLSPHLMFHYYYLLGG